MANKIDSSKPGCHLLKGHIEAIKQEVSDVISSLGDEMLQNGLWHEPDNELGVSRAKGKPVVALNLVTTGGASFYKCEYSFGEFLNMTEDNYSGGEDGWGEEMISDLELFKSEIQNHIDRMKVGIQAGN